MLAYLATKTGLEYSVNVTDVIVIVALYWSLDIRFMSQSTLSNNPPLLRTYVST
jgi:hypothetical protein